jgi:hypothetical protein
MSGQALSEYFRLREQLEDDPRSAGAVPTRDNEYQDAWVAQFSGSGLLIYRILDWEEPTLDPLLLVPPKPPPKPWPPSN